MTTAFEAVLRYDGAAIARPRRLQLEPCAIQPRDLALIDAVRRWKFLTTPQLLEIWWAGAAPQVGRRRLAKLFAAGYLDRFRPVARRGSFPWTYQLGREGHKLLQRAGLAPASERFEPTEIYDYRYVLHHVHLSAWVLAWRRLLGERLLAWDGERQIVADREQRSGPALGSTAGAAEIVGLRSARPRVLRPDAVLEVAGRNGGASVFLIEYDRTRRVDKNLDKFARYDAYCSGWWRESEYGYLQSAPWVVFICQGRAQRDAFMHAADRQLTGRVLRCGEATRDADFPGRRRALFVDERDMHEGTPLALRLPLVPPGDSRRGDTAVATVRLPVGLDARSLATERAEPVAALAVAR